VIADEDAYEDLADAASDNGGFNDVMMVGGLNQNATWARRVRRYGLGIQ
jgi:hypothetical protein